MSTFRSGRVIDISSTDDVGPFKSLYVGGTGNIALVTATGEAITFSTIPAGKILPIEGSQVTKVGTTATTIVAMN